MIFFKKEVLLSAPPSLVIFKLAEVSLIIGVFNSVPNKDHVPQDKNMKSSS